MSDATFRIFRGSHQIGGCSSEFRLGDHRIIIDFGANLPGTEDVQIDDNALVRTVFGNDDDIAATDAVLFTHYHGDHVGLKRFVPKNVPMYIGVTAKEIMKIIAGRVDSCKSKEEPEYKPEEPVIDRMKPYWKAGTPKNLSGISVTPLYIDHSALDSYMFVIGINGKRILYTGDFREHGINGGVFERLVKKYVGKVDILITEGTMLSRTKETAANIVKTEEDLGGEAAEVFAAHHENVVLVSSTNLDSIMEFYNAVPDGMAFLCDAYQAEIMEMAIDSVKKGKYNYRDHHRIYILSPDWRIAPRFVSKEYRKFFGDAQPEKYNELGFVMLARPNKPMFKKLLDEMNDPHIIYSMWSGYLKGGKCEDKNIVDFLSGHDDKDHFTQLHTSGHAYVETLAKLIEMTQPEVIIPMHTESADEFAKVPEFAAYKDRVNVLRDGEIYNI